MTKNVRGGGEDGNEQNRPCGLFCFMEDDGRKHWMFFYLTVALFIVF